MSTDQAKVNMWAVIAHLGGLVPGYFLCMVIPLLIWLLKGDYDPFVNKQAKEAFNFQLSLFIYESIAMIVAFTIIGLPLSALAFMLFWFLNFICSIYGAWRTFRGLTYEYPLNLRIVK